MSTIGSIGRNSYMMYKTMQTNPSLFNRLNNISSANSFSSLYSSGNKSYGASSQLQSILSNKWSQQQDTLNTVNEYMKKTEQFYDTFSDKMTDLKSSSKSLANTSFTADNADEIVKNAQNFAQDYNSAATFFNDNKSVSNAVKNLAISFSDTKYGNYSLNAIGISADSKGQLTVNEDKLRTAIANDANKVGSLLGQGGLAGKGTQKAVSALTSSANLVPFSSFATNSSRFSPLQGLLLDMYA